MGIRGSKYPPTIRFSHVARLVSADRDREFKRCVAVGFLGCPFKLMNPSSQCDTSIGASESVNRIIGNHCLAINQKPTTIITANRK